jgi:hypothetical protein
MCAHTLSLMMMIDVHTTDVTAKRSGNDKFWKEHCYAVPLDKFSSDPIAGKKVRRHTCFL